MKRRESQVAHGEHPLGGESFADLLQVGLVQNTLGLLLAARGSSQGDADAIVAAALAAATTDNATALVIDILTLPPPNHDAIAAEMADLPLLPPPEVGQNVDGFRHVSQILNFRHI